MGTTLHLYPKYPAKYVTEQSSRVTMLSDLFSIRLSLSDEEEEIVSSELYSVSESEVSKILEILFCGFPMSIIIVSLTSWTISQWMLLDENKEKIHELFMEVLIVLAVRFLL
jgi:hypothetical protein